MVARLREFGWRTLGAVAQVAGRELVNFLGSEGSRAWRLCWGEVPEPVRPVALPEHHPRLMVFPCPVDGEPGLLAAVQSLCAGLWADARLSGRTVGWAVLKGNLLEGGVWCWSRELRFPAGAAAALYAALKSGLLAQDSRGRAALPSGQLRCLTLTVSRFQAEPGALGGLGKGGRREPLPFLAGIAGIERLAPLDTASPAPERRRVLVTSRISLAEPLSIVVGRVDGVPSRVGSAGSGCKSELLAVSAVVDCRELDTSWCWQDPVSRRY